MTKHIEIDGVGVDLLKFTAAPGFKLLGRLTKLLGGSLFEIGGAVQGGKDPIAAFGNAIDTIMEKSKDDQLYTLLNDIVCTGFVSVNGSKITSLDDLGNLGEDVDPFYLGVMIAKEQLVFSFGAALKKATAAHRG